MNALEALAASPSPDPLDSTALTLRALECLAGGSLADREGALRALTAKAKAFRAGEAEQAMHLLALQVSVLEQLALHYLTKAAQPAPAHVQETYMRMGLRAQGNIIKIAALLHAAGRDDCKVIPGESE